MAKWGKTGAKRGWCWDRRPQFLLLAWAAVLCLQGCASLVLHRGFPQVGGEIRGLPLHGPVEILRDRWGIPHIYGQDVHDLIMAQGFVHAQDRLWQMEVNRRLAQGRLSELAGEAAVPLDYWFRLLGLPELRSRAAQGLSREELDLVQAYVSGVNAFLRLQGRDLPLEFRSLGLQPEPWTPEDALSSLAFNAWYLQTNYRQELLAIVSGSKLDRRAWDDLFPSHPGAVLPADAYWDSIRQSKTGPLLPSALSFYQGLPASPASAGSNNWVVADGPQGKPLLANDPHLAVMVPGVWYFCHLNAPTLHLAGASFAGTPGISIGHNGSVAWGITNVMTDCADLFVLQVDPARPSHYRVGDRSLEMSREELSFQLPGGRSKTMILYRTIYGPVITEVKEGVGSVVALKWYGTLRQGEGEDHSLRAFLALSRSGGVREALEAGRDMAFVGQNLVVADREGHIGWHVTGAVPIRSGYSGRLPADGSCGTMDWIGFLPYGALPHRIDPPEGWMATANQRVVADEDPHPISFSWAAPYRYERIAQLLQELKNPAIEDFRRIQMDVHSRQAEEILPRILAHPYGEEKARAAVRILEGWNRQVEAGSQGAALFETFLTEWTKALLEDELGAGLVLYLNAPGQYSIRDVILDRPDSSLWDRVDTPSREGPQEILEMALVRAMDRLEARLGPDPQQWTWGRLHPVNFQHPGGGRGGILGRLLNRGPYPAPGDCDTINAAGFIPVAGEEALWIASLRMIVPLGDLDGMQIIGPMGQSGQPGHPHYDDMIIPWLQGEMASLPFSREAVEKACTSRLTLLPGVDR